MLDFAEAIAGDHEVLQLHSGGNRYATVVVWPSSRPDVPFVVRLRSPCGLLRCIAVDLDVKDGPVDGDANMLGLLLASAGIQYAETVSGPSGGRHILFTLHEPVGEQATESLIASLRGRLSSLDAGTLSGSRTVAIRPPLALHRDGGCSEIVGDHLAAYQVLRDGNPNANLGKLLVLLGVEKRRAEFVATGPLSGSQVQQAIGPIGYGLLTGTGTKTGKDTTPSGVRFSIVMHCVKAGFTWGQVAHVVGPLIRKRQAEKGDSRDWFECLHGEYLKAVERCAANPAYLGPNDARMDVVRISDCADSVPWPANTGGTSEYAVFQALVAIGLKIGSRTVGSSQRQLAEDTGLTRKTVGKAITRLIEKGWLEMLEPSRDGRSSRYRLLIPDELSHDYPSNTSPIRGEGGVNNDGVLVGNAYRQVGTDAFLHTGSRKRVYAVLDPDVPMSPREIADALGTKSTSTVSRQLNNLEALGLAETLLDRTWVRLDRDMDEVAAIRGTLGHTEQVRQRNLVERDAFHDRYGADFTSVDPKSGQLSGTLKAGKMSRQRLGRARPPSEGTDSRKRG